MKQNIIKKLTSRKFILSVITAITGIITMILGGENEIVQTIAGAAMTIIPTIVYCLMEGFIDSQSVKTITNATMDMAEKLGADENTVDAIGKIGYVGEVLTEDDEDTE